MLDRRCLNGWLDPRRHFCRDIRVVAGNCFVFVRQINSGFFLKQEIDTVVIGASVGGTQIDNIGRCVFLTAKVHVEFGRVIHVGLERQVNSFCRTGNARAFKQLMVASNLLAHDHNLVPVCRVAVIADSGLQSRCCIDKRIPVAPDKVDLTQFGHEGLVVWIRFERPVDELCCLVIKTVGHVEIGLGNRVALVKIDGRVTAECVFEGAKLSGPGRAEIEASDIGCGLR